MAGYRLSGSSLWLGAEDIRSYPKSPATKTTTIRTTAFPTIQAVTSFQTNQSNMGRIMDRGGPGVSMLLAGVVAWCESR